MPAPRRSQRANPRHRQRASCGAPVREGSAASKVPPYSGRREELLGVRAGLDARGPRAPRAAYGAVPPVPEYALGIGGTSLTCLLGPLYARRLTESPHTHRTCELPQPSLPEPRVTRRPPRAQPPPAPQRKAELLAEEGNRAGP